MKNIGNPENEIANRTGIKIIPVIWLNIERLKLYSDETDVV
jgi:hypothetical protein